MYRLALSVLLSSLLLTFVGLVPKPASAGDYGYGDRYYDDGNRGNYNGNSYYRSGYNGNGNGYYRSGYYGNGYRTSSSYTRYQRDYEDDYGPSRRPYYRSSYTYSNGPSYSHSTRYYDQPRHYYGNNYVNSTGYSDQPRRFYSENCYPRRFKLYDDGGGWVWGTRTVCY